MAVLSMKHALLLGTGQQVDIRQTKMGLPKKDMVYQAVTTTIAKPSGLQYHPKVLPFVTAPMASAPTDSEGQLMVDKQMNE
jgi:hypothetical protein